MQATTSLENLTILQSQIKHERKTLQNELNSLDEKKLSELLVELNANKPNKNNDRGKEILLEMREAHLVLKKFEKEHSSDESIYVKISILKDNLLKHTNDIIKKRKGSLDAESREIILLYHRAIYILFSCKTNSIFAEFHKAQQKLLNSIETGIKYLHEKKIYKIEWKSETSQTVKVLKDQLYTWRRNPWPVPVYVEKTMIEMIENIQNQFSEHYFQEAQASAASDYFKLNDAISKRDNKSIVITNIGIDKTILNESFCVACVELLREKIEKMGDAASIEDESIKSHLMDVASSFKTMRDGILAKYIHNYNLRSTNLKI